MSSSGGWSEAAEVSQLGCVTTQATDVAESRAPLVIEGISDDQYVIANLQIVSLMWA